MNDVTREVNSRITKIRRTPGYAQDLKNMDTALEKITLGLKIIYGGYENIPESAMKLARLGKERPKENTRVKKSSDTGKIRASKMRHTVSEPEDKNMEWEDSTW